MFGKEVRRVADTRNHARPNAPFGTAGVSALQPHKPSQGTDYRLPITDY
jgi:hypothetical protein